MFGISFGPIPHWPVLELMYALVVDASTPHAAVEVGKYTPLSTPTSPVVLAPIRIWLSALAHVLSPIATMPLWPPDAEHELNPMMTLSAFAPRELLPFLSAAWSPMKTLAEPPQ
jgi:hypothetical protein